MSDHTDLNATLKNQRDKLLYVRLKYLAETHKCTYITGKNKRRLKPHGGGKSISGQTAGRSTDELKQKFPP